MRRLLILLALPPFAGCATNRADYVPPAAFQTQSNVRVVDLSRDQVWDRLIPALSRQYFVINTIDRASGLVNVSYSGDPERYLDCGQITGIATVSGQDEVTRFPGARGRVEHVARTPLGLPIVVALRMELEGRVNISAEAIGPRQTRLTASTRYVVTRRIENRQPNGQIARTEHQISFNSGGNDRFELSATSFPLECRATGALEQELLRLAGP